MSDWLYEWGPSALALGLFVTLFVRLWRRVAKRRKSARMERLDQLRLWGS